MSEAILKQLEESGLFRDFDASAKQVLASKSRTQCYANGEVIYRIGEPSTALYGVLDGAVKLFGEDANGKFYLFGLTAPGRWFGDSSALDGEPRGQTIIAAGKTQVVKYLRSDLLALLDSRPELYKHFVSVFCRRLREAGRTLEDNAFLPVSVRLAKQLLRLEKVRSRFNITLTQEELAASLGVSRQSIYRVLKKWEAEGLVSMTYGNVTLKNFEAMSALMGDIAPSNQ